MEFLSLLSRISVVAFFLGNIIEKNRHVCKCQSHTSFTRLRLEQFLFETKV